jgi:hypothetical protein
MLCIISSLFAKWLFAYQILSPTNLGYKNVTNAKVYRIWKKIVPCNVPVLYNLGYNTKLYNTGI